MTYKPEILAPAGNRASFLAAIAAGADAIYCGLKHFSARMAADNFTLGDLASLTELAKSKGIRVYIALNTLIKFDEIAIAGKTIDILNKHVKPHALIIQDPGLIELIEKTGFKGEVHLSTLSNVTFPAALKLFTSHKSIKRVVLPRELTIDEIKIMATACPRDLGLEVFIHGALCYGVSGRCYWSSYLGGKSGLRGQCVQPCRRVYNFENRKERYFSCRDLYLDVLVKPLLDVPKVKAWKIEGRKKGPHYVYYTVEAYKVLRDLDSYPAEDKTRMKKNALSMLEQALGRPGTNYFFLPQRKRNPVSLEEQTGSGMLAGSVKTVEKKLYIAPRTKLLPGDLLRVGYEDKPGHRLEKVRRFVPKKGKLFLSGGKKTFAGIPVFLIDRREKALNDTISTLEKSLSPSSDIDISASSFAVKERVNAKKSNTSNKGKITEHHVSRRPVKKKVRGEKGIWITKDFTLEPGISRDCRLWLPPVIWPDESDAFADLISGLVSKGFSKFMLNAPWQAALFQNPKKIDLWAGPFCNIANASAIRYLKILGIKGVVVSPELDKNDYYEIAKTTPLPLGIVISGNWPFCVSRTFSDDMDTQKPFDSPRGEKAWAAKHGSLYWVFPNWEINLEHEKSSLSRAGYTFFVNLNEPVPEHVKMIDKNEVWNWKMGLK